MTVPTALDAAGRRRSPATRAGLRAQEALAIGERDLDRAAGRYSFAKATVAVLRAGVGTMVAPTRADEPNKAIEDGRVALGRGAWAEARVRFADALAQEETPEAFEGAGLAARYELDAEGAIEAHERGSAWPGRAGTPRVLHVSRSSSATTRMHFGGRLRPRAGLSAPRCSLRGSRRTLRPRGCQ
jgi:hypothetical protein